jgi:glycosyltransferase involved in cell wall biosynthesis
LSGTGSGQPIRIVRIIARLNIGGPAIQAITLTQRLRERGYETVLVRGVEEPGEGNMDHLAAELDVKPVLVPTVRRNPSWRDLPALLELVRIIRRERPAIVHTHAAKAGTLGRLAALLAFPLRGSRPILIHTYHGHSLSGYFSDRTANVYRTIERALGRSTDRLIAVSDEVRDELVSMRVAPVSKFAVVPLGFDLEPFALEGAPRAQRRDAVRAELGISTGTTVVTLIARLVPIKRVDRFLRMATMLKDIPDVRFLIVGDGELREPLRDSPDAQVLGERLIWAGFRQDMPAICFASDLVVQTSDNEGTPVSLIEAQAAGTAVVSTRVGGTPSVVVGGVTGALVEPHDVVGFSAQVRQLIEDGEARTRMGAAGRQHTIERFTLDRLTEQVDEVYRNVV